METWRMASGSPADHLDKIIEQAEEQYYDGDFEGAEANLRKGLNIAEELGLDDLRLASVLNTLAGVMRSTDREEEALEPSLRAFKILERDMEPGDEDLAGVASNIAQIY